eukprot:4106972-Pyramimonas_sp.AAC.1
MDCQERAPIEGEPPSISVAVAHRPFFLAGRRSGQTNVRGAVMRHALKTCLLYTSDAADDTPC